MKINGHDRDVLRGLAGRLRGLADRPEMSILRNRWKRHNALDPDGPMILCFPEGAWTEILTDADLVCKDETARGFERSLRMRLYTAEVIRDDQPVDPTFDVGWQVTRGDYGVAVPETHGDNRGSYVYESPLRNLPDDFGKLHFRQPSVDRAATEQTLARARDAFGDLLDVRMRGAFWWTLGLTWEAIKLIGLEELMVAPYDQPDNLHRLMAWLRDEHLHFISWFEKQGLLSDQNEADYVGSGGVGYTDELPGPGREPGAPARLIDRWGFAESQETVGMSPEMFAEFVLPYQIPLMEKFGLNYYGCCEPLDKRWEHVKRIPRLRRVAVAPWADPGVMADHLKRDYVFCRKPNPAPVCVGFQEDVIRAELRNTLAKAGDCVLEITLKDTHTVENDPARLARWVQIAREEVLARG